MGGGSSRNVSLSQEAYVIRWGGGGSSRIFFPGPPPESATGQCLSDETVKAVGPFYLVSMTGEVKDPTNPHWNV